MPKSFNLEAAIAGKPVETGGHQFLITQLTWFKDLIGAEGIYPLRGICNGSLQKWTACGVSSVSSGYNLVMRTMKRTYYVNIFSREWPVARGGGSYFFIDPLRSDSEEEAIASIPKQSQHSLPRVFHKTIAIEVDID